MPSKLLPTLALLSTLALFTVAQQLNADTLTKKTIEAINGANKLASAYGHVELSTLHIASILFQDKDGLARRVTEKAGVDHDRIDRELDKDINPSRRKSRLPLQYHPALVRSGRFRQRVICKQRTGTHTWQLITCSRGSQLMWSLAQFLKALV
jgi:ATP-dependent Clp protease ATP-binding subunit ClpA